MNWLDIIAWMHGTGLTIVLAAAPGVIGWAYNARRRQRLEDTGWKVIQEADAYDRMLDEGSSPRSPNGDDYNAMHAILMQIEQGLR